MTSKTKRTRSRIGRLGPAAALLGALTSAAPAAGTDAESAAAMVRTTVGMAVEILDDGSLSPSQKRTRVEALVDEHFDFPVIARIVVKERWREFSGTQRTAFIEEFKKHLSATYGKRLEAYQDERVEFGEARVGSKGDVTVATHIVGGSAGSGVAIDYRVRERDGAWYVIDVKIEGVSMDRNLHEQIKSLLHGSTPDELIEKLRAKNAAKTGAEH
jgi:phospholipid transport system substrate-binding protein